jgi:hypothetical protein
MPLGGFKPDWFELCLNLVLVSIFYKQYAFYVILSIVILLIIGMYWNLLHWRDLLTVLHIQNSLQCVFLLGEWFIILFTRHYKSHLAALRFKHLYMFAFTHMAARAMHNHRTSSAQYCQHRRMESGHSMWVIRGNTKISILARPWRWYPERSAGLLPFNFAFLTTGFRHGVNKTCALLAFYTDYNGSILPTLQYNLSVPSLNLA